MYDTMYVVDPSDDESGVLCLDRNSWMWEEPHTLI